MKKSLEVLNSFETQTEEELREVMGGSFKLSDVLGLIKEPIMCLYAVMPPIDVE